jgi:hypothetical protein
VKVSIVTSIRAGAPGSSISSAILTLFPGHSAQHSLQFQTRGPLERSRLQQYRQSNAPCRPHCWHRKNCIARRMDPIRTIAILKARQQRQRLRLSQSDARTPMASKGGILQPDRRFRIPALFCALSVRLCELISRPCRHRDLRRWAAHTGCTKTSSDWPRCL